MHGLILFPVATVNVTNSLLINKANNVRTAVVGVRPVMHLSCLYVPLFPLATVNVTNSSLTN